MSGQEQPTARKVLMTIPAAALGTEEDVQVLVWDWSTGPVEVDFRMPAEEWVVWTPLSLMGGHAGRVD